MDRQTAAELLDNLVGMVNDTSGNDYDTALKMGIEALNSDAVEVVRCKDCVWYKTDYSWNGKKHKVCAIEPYDPVNYDFCSRGERKDG